MVRNPARVCAIPLAFVGCSSHDPLGAEADCGDELWVIVQRMPELQNAGYVNTQGRYPIDAARNGIEGRVIVQYIVDRTGTTHDHEVTLHLCPDCDREALRLVELAKFAPGMQRGEAVCVQLTIPVEFSLTDQSVTIPNN